MAEHTPTTETVRDCFVDGAAGDFIEEDFDRWLAAHDAELRAECSLLNHENRLADAAVKIGRLKAERDEAQRQVADLRAGIEVAVVTLNREAYRQPTPWIDRLANDLRALLARGGGVVMTADDTVTAKLAEWEALANAATEGPWTFEPAGESECGEPQCCYECWDNRIWGGGTVLTESHMLSEADAEFIAAARTATPALLGFVRDMVCAVHVSSSESRGVGRVDPETGEWGAYCDGDGEWWPCPTVQALTKWIGGEG